MKIKALISAAAMVCGGAAFAQAEPPRSSGNTAQASEMQHAPASPRMREGARRVVDKTREVTRRATDKVREVASRDRNGDRRHAGDRHERMDRHHASGPRHMGDRHHANDTRSMGAPAAARDGDGDRRARMDAAYENWRMQQDAPRR